jgi:hypothetical protein
MNKNININKEYMNKNIEKEYIYKNIGNMK